MDEPLAARRSASYHAPVGEPTRRTDTSKEGVAELSSDELDGLVARAYDLCRFCVGEPERAEAATLAALAAGFPETDDAWCAQLVTAVDDEAAGEPLTGPRWPPTGDDRADNGRSFIADRIGEWSVRERLAYSLVARNKCSVQTAATALGTSAAAVEATLDRLRGGLTQALQVEASDDGLRSALPPFDASEHVRNEARRMLRARDAPSRGTGGKRTRGSPSAVAFVVAILLIVAGAALLLLGIAGIMRG